MVTKRIAESIKVLFYTHIYGEWESLTMWAWIYGHISIFIATALIGYTFAKRAYAFTVILLIFPTVYLFKRYEKAREYKVQSNPPVNEYDKSQD